MPSLSSIAVLLLSFVVVGVLLTRAVKLISVWISKHGKKTKKSSKKRESRGQGTSAMSNKESSSPPKRLISPYSRAASKKVVEVESVSPAFEDKSRHR
ncbi:MAG: hypothetical protein AB8U44_00465 [Aaplasma endosymbiont of Hyalomma asiaticum]